LAEEEEGEKKGEDKEDDEGGEEEGEAEGDEDRNAAPRGPRCKDPAGSATRNSCPALAK
jgi:hypothetical protein